VPIAVAAELVVVSSSVGSPSLVAMAATLCVLAVVAVAKGGVLEPAVGVGVVIVAAAVVVAAAMGGGGGSMPWHQPLFTQPWNRTLWQLWKVS